MTDFDLGSLEVTNGGLDAFLGGNPEVVSPVLAVDVTAALQIRPKEYRFEQGFGISGTPPQPDEDKGRPGSRHKVNIWVRRRETADAIVAIYKKTSLTQKQQSDAIDKLIREEGKAKSASGRTKVGSLAQLNGFIRTAEDTLVHKSSRELWALRQEGADGDFYIERMFDEMGGPLKG